MSLGSWLDGLGRDLGQLADRALDRHLRLAVTGLRRSGKTVLITAIVHHLMSGRALPFLEAVHAGRYLGARPQPLQTGTAFPYQRFLQDLTASRPRWPVATDRLSRVELLLRTSTTNALLRPLQPVQELTLEIIDYPGEWLLDLPMLHQSFAEFSGIALDLARQGERAALARDWSALAHGLDQQGPADPVTLDPLVASYKAYLHEAQQRHHLSFLQPGRFLNPGDALGAETLQWSPLPEATGGPARELMIRRFERYKAELVQGFYEEHFRSFDRQIVLVDLLSVLNHGPECFEDAKLALAAIMESFRYGRSGILARLLAPRIDRLLFAASKADHVAPSQHAALKQLLELMIAPSARAARFEGLKPEVMALAALRCTDAVRTEHDGQVLTCVRGRLEHEDRETVLFPGELPADLPEPEDWRSGRFRFKDFAPRRLEPAKPNQHIRLDQALEYLIGDKLR